MSAVDTEFPCLRPVEAIPDPTNQRVILRDPTQLATGMLVVAESDLMLISLMDGSHSRVQIQAAYARQHGRLLLSHELEGLLAELDRAGFLAGAGFERYYAGVVEEYRAAPYRPLRDANGFGAPAASLRDYLSESIAAARGTAPPRPAEPAGLVAPHLDFPRGRPCYGAGYACLDPDRASQRVVVLGTNHFGRSRSVVGTRKDFQTPWGIIRTDREFFGRLEAECGGNLAPFELDHLHEHSIELHAVWLHHLLGDGARIVPFLCPDPSGPDGTRAGDPEGVDLREFALALGHLIRHDPGSTLVVASADLSHVGRYFGDRRLLTDPFLEAVRDADEAALKRVDANDPEGFREHMAQTGNPTRVCSVGCLYALMTALGPDAEPYRLRYHQAVTREIQNAVTCAAYAFYR